MNNTMERMLVASRLISGTYNHLREVSREIPLLMRNRPLNTASMLEKDLRGALLDYEPLARQKQEAIMNYLDQNTGILTEEARTLLFRISLSPQDMGMYVTKIAVPETGSMEDHKTIISVVSFKDYRETVEIFDNLIIYSDISPLENPIQRDNHMGKYWAAISQTDLEMKHKTETTRIKIRGRKN